MLNKLVLTGAAGRLGSSLREPLAKLCKELVSTDIVPIQGPLLDSERFIQANLNDLAAIEELTKGADMIVHFGAIGDETEFDAILQSNIIGVYNIWEAAHRNGIRRVVYASSIHAVGMYPKTEFIDTNVQHRPDTYYGLAKCFAEDLARMVWEKRGIEAVCLRILSCSKVNNTRSLGSWLSYDDLHQLVRRAIETPITGFTVVYGVSNNDRVPVDNSQAAFLGYRPKDNAEQFAPEILANAQPSDPSDAGQMCHGGAFASVALGHSGNAGMTIEDERA
ncbi:NAD-dependent epimerase/dehydratase family protein [Planktotalea sp.]|uniref:NAD-dependent epimerase/dehydratase family protein n=1 Tax=Planktotalea sp. TaxID=2029877 RepID=UPI003D6C0219